METTGFGTSPKDGDSGGEPPPENLERLERPNVVVVPKWIQLVLLPLALLGLWALARASGTVLLVLLIASVVALILNPLAKIYQRVMPRGLAIVGAYLTVLAVLAAIAVLLANPISTQVNHFSNNVPQLVRSANHELDSLQRWLRRNGINVQIEKQGQTALQTLEHRVLKSSGTIVTVSRDLLGKLISFSVDAVLVLVLSVYLLVYAPRIGDLVRRLMPPGDGTPQDDYPLLVQRSVFGYVRGQLLFSLIMGISATIALFLLGVIGIFPDGEHYAVFFGAFYGLMELIPYIGPFLGALPAVLVALFTDPVTALWVALTFLGLQQLEGHVVAPQVFRIHLRINPILVILALLIGYQLYGIAGMFVALPLAAVIRQTVEYLRDHLVLESWNTPLSLGGSAPPASAPANAPGADAPAATPGADAPAATPGSGAAPASEPCPHCNEPTDPADMFCRSCGAPLLRDEVSTLHESG